jgi:hypothetical protein
MSRSLARAQRFRVEIGGSVDLTLPFPMRPKGMHIFTYLKLAIRGMAAEAQFNTDVRNWTDNIWFRSTNKRCNRPQRTLSALRFLESGPYHD